jgi:hypothetical protein
MYVAIYYGERKLMIFHTIMFAIYGYLIPNPLVHTITPQN